MVLWQGYEVKDLQTASVLVIPEMAVQDIALYLKKRLGIGYLRIAGDLTMPCTRIGLLVGYRGRGELAINLIEKEDLDLVIYGEGPEWETPEYIRDALQQGKRRALIALGHAESEAPGMEYLARWLKEKFPDVPVHFIPQQPIFKIL